MKVYYWANLSEPIKGLWVHGVLYYKYATYQKIATEYWDDLCKWASGKSHSYLLDFFKPFLAKYSNINHTCPYSGLVYIKADKVSVNKLIIPQIIPSGRYRFDFEFTENDRKTVLFSTSVFGSISDHRVEIV